MKCDEKTKTMQRRMQAMIYPFLFVFEIPFLLLLVPHVGSEKLVVCIDNPS
ncbi:hypothetical protein [Sutcliffiella sp. BMC8]|uniref:hypothetical protein n=1 Tax=Sutcliffiella sp. BMC8 TaxID=3073243 RepID=UPI0030CB248F